MTKRWWMKASINHLFCTRSRNCQNSWENNNWNAQTLQNREKRRRPEMKSPSFFYGIRFVLCIKFMRNSTSIKLFLSLDRKERDKGGIVNFELKKIFALQNARNSSKRWVEKAKKNKNVLWHCKRSSRILMQLFI